MKSDMELQRSVLDELEWEPAVTATHIGVTVRRGVITLVGHVPSYAEKSQAAAATARIFGVKAVVNELDVKLPESCKRSDDDIAAACALVLAACSWMPNNRVRCVVRDGWVTLSGQLEWFFQKEQADRCIRDLVGVRGITNGITLKPKVGGDEIKKQIEAAFQRNAEIDATRVFVETQGGKVTLTGRVRSLAQMHEATHAAWAAPGVTSVENAISIQP